MKVYIDLQTVINIVLTLICGGGLLYFGGVIRQKGEFKRRNLVINTFITEWIRTGVMDEKKYMKWVETRNAPSEKKTP